MGMQLPGSSFVHPDSPLRDALTAAAARQVTRMTGNGNEWMPIGKMIDQVDKDIPRRRKQIGNQPFATIAMVVQVASQENAQHHGKQNLPGQAEFYIFHMIYGSRPIMG